MPTVSEEKNAHYRVIEQRIMMSKALEHFIGSKEFENFVSDIYQKDPFYSAMGVGSDDILQEVKTGVTICIGQLKEQVKGYLV
jgi:hypothetical protein